MGSGEEYRLSKIKPNIHGRGKEPETINDVYKRAYYSLFECDLNDFSTQCNVLANNAPEGDADLWQFAFFNLLSEMTSQNVITVSENGRRFHTKPHSVNQKRRSISEIRRSHQALKFGMMLERAGADKHGWFEKSSDIVRKELGVNASDDGYSDETLRKLWSQFKKIRKENKDLS